jgi:hypothetical protein
MELDTEERFHLKAGMSQVFQDYSELRRFLLEECGKQINEKSNASVGLAENISVAIQWAESEGWLDDLLAKLQQHPNLTVRSMAEIIAGNFEARRPIFFEQVSLDPLSALFIAREECFIGRDNLRDSLRALKSDVERKRVLIITGQQACGKSYSYQLLRMLDSLSPSNIVVRIDFKRFREGALADRYRDIIGEINTRLDVPYDRIPEHNESETRWFELAIRKFDNVVRERGKKLWLVFDHIRTANGVEPNIADALTKVATYATDDSQRLRIVLIDLDPADLLWERKSSRVKIDYAELPSKADIEAFLQSANLAAKANLQGTELADAADKIVSSLTGLDRQERGYKLAEETWGHVVRLNLLDNRSWTT